MGYPLALYTYHIAVTQLFHGKNLTGRLARWYLTIQQFEPHLSICLTKPTLLQMLSHATFQLLQLLRFLTFPHLRCARLNAKTLTLWSKVIYALESGDDSTLPHMSVPLLAFTLKEDVLCRMGTVAKTQVT